MARSTFCVDGWVESQTNHACALVFEKLHWLIHRAPDADDYTYAENGQVWQEFTYARLFKFFDMEKENGTKANILGVERTLRRAIKELVEAGLLITRRCQRGIALAINHKTLKRVVGKENYRRYSPDLQQMSTQELEDNPDLQQMSTQNPSSLTTNVHSELQQMSTQPIYKESDSLKDKQLQKDLPSDKSPDEETHAFDSLMQLANLPALTTLQKETLIKWIMVTRGHYPNPVHPQTVGMGAKEIRTLGALVKKDILTQSEAGISTRLTRREIPKSILMNATYEDLGETPLPPAKLTDKPFWELCAAMHCWNTVNMHWRKYFGSATPREAGEMNQRIKQTCEALDEIHEDEPISVEEFKDFIKWWYEQKFKKEAAEDKYFPTSQEALARNFLPYRTFRRQEQMKQHEQQSE